MVSTNTVKNNNISLVGIPFSGGQPKGGVDLGPSSLRQAGIESTVQHAGWNVVHNKDVTIAPKTVTQWNKLRNPHWVGTVCKSVYEHVHERVKDGEMALMLGGDHSIAAGSIAAVLSARPDAFVIWVDAHADINTPESTDSGNIHGMPVALLAKLAGEVPGFEWMNDIPTLRTDRIAYIGLRDVDEGEKVLLRNHNIKHFWASDVKRMGISAVMDEVLSYSKDCPIHISFDIDGLDPNFAPATGTPVLDGITLEDGKHICSRVAASGKLVSMDLVEVNPSLSDADGANTTDHSAIELAQAALENRRTA